VTAASGIRLRAFVGPTEVPIVNNAARLLVEVLAWAGAEAPEVGVEFAGSLAELSAAGADVAIASMLPEVEAARQDWQGAEPRLARDYQVLAQRGGRLTFLCTVFRHVPAELDEEVRTALRLTLRRLGLLAVHVSHADGLNLIDLDRALAHVGARSLGTDYRLTGIPARKAAGRAIARAILAAGLDEWVAPEIQDRAAARIGGS
jgi:hypothetical protein